MARVILPASQPGVGVITCEAPPPSPVPWPAGAIGITPPYWKPEGRGFSDGGNAVTHWPASTREDNGRADVV